MKVRITVADVDLRLDGHELTTREIRALMRHAAGIALALTDQEKPTLELEEPRTGLGFTAHLELDGARHEPIWPLEEEPEDRAP